VLQVDEIGPPPVVCAPSLPMPGRPAARAAALREPRQRLHDLRCGPPLLPPFSLRNTESHAGEHTVQQIADMFSVPRTTVYGHLDNATKGKRPGAQRSATVPAATSMG